MGKINDFAFEQGMVVGTRHTGLSVSRTATLLGLSHSTVSTVYQEWSTTQRTASRLDTAVFIMAPHSPTQQILFLGSSKIELREALESTWASIPVERFRHLVKSMPRQIEAILRAKGRATQYKEGVPNVWNIQCRLG